jgi:hypothetical protein
MKTLILGLLLGVVASRPLQAPSRGGALVIPYGNDGRHVVRTAKRSMCEASDLCEVVGYVVLACSNVVGEFEGADFGKSVSLDNGMIFTFDEYNYSYAYRPDAVVLARNVNYQGRQLIVYKLVIEDETYEVTRVR